MELILRTRESSRVAVVNKVTACEVSEKLSGEKTLSFETLMTDTLRLMQDAVDYVVEFEAEFYDVVSIQRILRGGLYFMSFSCEHVSYRLSDVNLDAFTSTGTPAQILSDLLAGTGFSRGTVEPDAAGTFSLQQGTTKRGAILAYAEAFGYDVRFTSYRVNLYLHLGSSTPRTLVERNVVSVSKSTDLTEDETAYSCTLYDTEVALGDEVAFRFDGLGIHENVRVLGVTKCPFTSRETVLEVNHFSHGLELEAARVNTDSVQLQKNYFGVKISAAKGLEILRSDGQSKVIMNADEFRMQAANESGNLADKLYFDPVTGEYKFCGNVSIMGGDIDIGGNFRVDQSGNAYLSGDATIYGGRFFAGQPGEAESFSQMTSTGFEVYNTDMDLKLKFGYTSEGEDYPFIQLGSGSGQLADFGLIKKFDDGLWIGNSEPQDESGAFAAKNGYNGIFFSFEDNAAYIVHNTTLANIYTGAAIARFG